ncbi:MAG: DUF2461 domain-containing protein [Reichenbachiella sp.]|uniref:DUF2461 domain-containing protein n=1 Tax=Reichenbachiella sp. TaxID=2184521 RepID=UPI002966E809|nr:DUF2461 domain-containing protein [Reichenbachiella sp.]MDW3208429.1 DUF2461 domain-containing protein [Reichenbachiella sp.]
MKYFTESFTSFFNELAINNQKEWFHANKKRYESEVKKPFEFFLSHLIAAIQKEDPSLSISPKDCILRINRGLRFSKDKTPYNLHYSAVVSNGGRKDKSVPGLFLRFTPEEVGIMGGAYVLNKDQLFNLRSDIKKNPTTLKVLIQEESFKAKFGTIQGEESKRMPVEFQEASEKNPLLLKKQFYFVSRRESTMITSDHLLDELMDYWRAARPLNEYLTSIIHN